jgi:hypothetical protein
MNAKPANRSAVVGFANGDSRLSVGFYSKGSEKTQVAVDHGKLPNSKECAKMKIFWFEALNRLERTLT